MENQEMANNVKVAIDENAAILQKLTEMVNQNTDKLRKLLELLNKVDGDGYLEVDGIVRRWIPAQCLAMLHSDVGFHESLIKRLNAYNYSWKVLIDDLAKQCELFESSDMEGYKDRNRWYNQDIAWEMATDFVSQLREYVSNLTGRCCKGRGYVKVRTWLNNGKGVFINELEAWYESWWVLARGIRNAKSPRELCKAIYAFDVKRRQTRVSPSALKVSDAFVNVYKAVGAYYTAKDLIMFENCFMKDCHSTDESLDALEQKADEVINAGVYHDGYKMFGVLRELLKHNDFNYEATKEKWAEQSKKRRAYRQEQRDMRRSR